MKVSSIFKSPPLLGMVAGDWQSLRFLGYSIPRHKENGNITPRGEAVVPGGDWSELRHPCPAFRSRGHSRCSIPWAS